VLPLRDVNPTRRLPVLTIALIAINFAVFIYQQQKPDDASLGGQTAFACEYGLVPDHLIDGHVQASLQGGVTCGEVNAEHNRFLGLFTSMFLHGSWFHLLGNMLFLWVFGNNIEDRLGRIRFLPFYLICGALAGLSQALTDTNSDVPLIGASGAIAGILGAYLLLFPRAMVWSWIFPIFVLPIPAFLVLIFWFVYQFVYAAGVGEVGAGVAYWAHVGGFLAGLILIRPFLLGRREPPPPTPPAGATVWDRGGLP
jgi:membrane associated rhomboid family serine protease